MTEQNKAIAQDMNRQRSYEELLGQPKPERCPEMEWNKILALAYMRDKHSLNLEMIAATEAAGFRAYRKEDAKKVDWFHLKNHGDLIKELKRLFGD